MRLRSIVRRKWRGRRGRGNFISAKPEAFIRTHIFTFFSANQMNIFHIFGSISLTAFENSRKSSLEVANPLFFSSVHSNHFKPNGNLIG